MNGSHLPAGQPGIPVGGSGVGGVGVGVGGARGPHSHAVEMGSGAPGNGHQQQRRPPPPQYPAHQHQHSYHHQQQHVNHNHMYYNSPMNPYASSYYPQVPPHYQNGALPPAPYMSSYSPYQQARSPPAMHQQQYAPIVSSSMAAPPPASYSRPQQPSPVVATPPYQAPATLPPAPIPLTPSSSHSSQAVTVPLTPPTPQAQEITPSQPGFDVIPATFRPPLPWLSRPDLTFPARAARSKRRRRIMTSETGQLELPSNQQTGGESTVEQPASEQSSSEQSVFAPVSEPPTLKNAIPIQPPVASTEPVERSETLSTQNVRSKDAHSTSPTTPVSVLTTTQNSTAASVTPTQSSSKPAARTALRAVPVVPILPKFSPRETETAATAAKPTVDSREDVSSSSVNKPNETEAVPTNDTSTQAKPESAPAPVRVAPKLWTGLFASAAPPVSAVTDGNGAAVRPTVKDAKPAEGGTIGNGNSVTGSFVKNNASSVAEALREYRVTDGHGQKVSFLEPRGLINTGNMCYMNSVLQVLIFCIPFYEFLDQVGKKAAHSFKSETPLVDAMIMFMREFKVIDSATVDLLGRRLKNEEYEQYGEPFTPEFVYDAIRKIKRFENMKHGHQQDAQEFLGLLLESFHEECALVMRHLPESSTTTTAANSSVATPTVSSPTSTNDASGWLEVGHRQRAAVTRSSGHPTELTPITKIFGGQLRSELKVPGLKDSVTLEPYQPLQLDIDSPQVHNIVDALRNMTRPEPVHGDFNSPRGRDVTATKQLFIEYLPPVLILHLKRFQYQAEGTRTVKISKKVGYPLELELPKEVFSRQKRSTLTPEAGGLPKYKLIATVYHHGKNASGGHYTVDVRRQDGREWIRLDDTVIRRVRSEDVAEGGVEEDVSKQPIADNKTDNMVGSSGNRFESIGDEDNGDDEGWNKVSQTSGTKKWSSVVNGATPKAALPAKAKPIKDNIKDNKVAYLLFYQKV